MRKSRGITLIAPVITIVVLLILAGVSLRLVVGEYGILRRTEKAVEKSNQAQQEEDEKLKKLDKYIGANFTSKISKVNSQIGRNQIYVSIDVADKETAKVVYSIRKIGETELKEITEPMVDLAYTFENLEEGQEYEIAIKVIDEFGEMEKKIQVSTLEIASVMASAREDIANQVFLTEDNLWHLLPFGTETANTWFQWELSESTALNSFSFKQSAGAGVSQLGGESVNIEFILMGSKDGNIFEPISKSFSMEAPAYSGPESLKEEKFEIHPSEKYKFYRMQFTKGGFEDRYLSIERVINFGICGMKLTYEYNENYN